MKLDRELQLKILQTLRDAYPGRRSVHSLSDLDGENFMANMMYLAEHRLISASGIKTDTGPPAIAFASITAKGLDFLEADGGLDAILRTITVKFDPDQLREILAGRVDQMDLPPEKKKPLLEKFKTMPADVLLEVLIKLAEKGLEHAPDALSLIQKMIA